MRVGLVVKPLLPEVRLFKTIDPVKLPSGSADPIEVDNNEKVELRLKWPLSRCCSVLLIVLLAVTSSVVKLACVTVEPVRLVSRTVPP